jgi:hypothetical protein
MNTQPTRPKQTSTTAPSYNERRIIDRIRTRRYRADETPYFQSRA